MLKNKSNRRNLTIDFRRFVFGVLLIFIFLYITSGLLWSNILKKPRIFVSIPPQKFMVQKIAGELVEVEVLVGPGQSPSTYEPTPRQMTALAGADLFFRIGVPFEDHLLEKIENIFPDLHVVDVRKGIELRYFGNEHETADGHHHGTEDPHIWLDPLLAKIQGETMVSEIRALIPERSALLDSGYNAFCRGLDSLDRQINSMVAGNNRRTFLIFHPTFGYLADRYGLNQMAIEREGKEPGVRYLAELTEQARREKITAIIVQPQYSTKSAEVLAAAIDARVVKIDPLPDSFESYAANILKLISTVVLDGR